MLKERFALVQILEFAKFKRNASDTMNEENRWQRVINISFEALGKPSMADIDNIRREAADHQSYQDLAASGGLVDVP